MHCFRMGTVFSSLFVAFSGAPKAYSTTTLGAGSKRAGFGAGCYWGTEKFFKSEFGSAIAGQVGFMGPPNAKSNPSYAEVCTGTTQQVEVYDLEYDGDDGTYEKLVKHFFKFHDPTTIDRQGNDRGTQYASVIYVYDAKQREIASKIKDELQLAVDAKKIKYKEKSVVTDIRDATVFYPAHLEHQNYLELNPGGYCNHNYRFKNWPSLSKEGEL